MENVIPTISAGSISEESALGLTPIQAAAAYLELTGKVPASGTDLRVLLSELVATRIAAVASMDASLSQGDVGHAEPADFAPAKAGPFSEGGRMATLLQRGPTFREVLLITGWRPERARRIMRYITWRLGYGIGVDPDGRIRLRLPGEAAS